MKERYGFLHSIARFFKNLSPPTIAVTVAVTLISATIGFLVWQKAAGEKERQAKQQEHEQEDAAREKRRAERDMRGAYLDPLHRRNEDSLEETGMAGGRSWDWKYLSGDITAKTYAAETNRPLLTLMNKAGISMVPSLREGEAGYLAVDATRGYLGLNTLYPAERSEKALVSLMRAFNDRIETKTNYFGLYTFTDAPTNKNISFMPFGTNLLATNYLPVYGPVAPTIVTITNFVTNAVSLTVTNTVTNFVTAATTNTVISSTNNPFAAALKQDAAARPTYNPDSMLLAVLQLPEGAAFIRQARAQGLTLIPLPQNSSVPFHIASDSKGQHLVLKISVNTRAAENNASAVATATELLKLYRDTRISNPHPTLYYKEGSQIRAHALSPGETRAQFVPAYARDIYYKPATNSVTPSAPTP